MSDQESVADPAAEKPTKAAKLVDTDAEESSEDGGVDSSEEDDDEDEDEDAIRKVQEGFIVDDDEEEQLDTQVRRKKHRKRKKRAAASEELDEDDYNLILENAGEAPAQPNKFKRLKRGGNAGAGGDKGKDLTDMFSDEEAEGSEGEGVEEVEEDDLAKVQAQRSRGEFDDFIEEDEMSEEDEDRDERLARMRSARVRNNYSAETNIDQDKMDELFEIFGDGEEYSWALKAQEQEKEQEESGDRDDEDEDEEEEEGEDDWEASPKKSERTLKDVFEYEELKQHLLTDRDQQIRVADVPERFQLLREGIEDYQLEGEEFVKKQKWIADKLFEEKKGAFEDSEAAWEPFKDCVYHVVEFVARDNLEVPTIWSVRKEYTLRTYEEAGELHVQKLLNENDLWRIVQLDIEYHAILSKRRNVQKLYDTLDVVDMVYDEGVQTAKSIPELQDLYDYITFTYSQEERRKTGRKQRRHVIIDKIRSDPIYAVVKAMGLTAQQFGENIVSSAKIYVTEDDTRTPEALAADIVPGSYFGSVEKALGAVKYVYSEELAHNPALKGNLRTAYQNYATVDIELTEKGKVEIGEKSPYVDFKYAINRAMESFAYQPDLFLRMAEAESLGLVRIHIGLKNAYTGFVDNLFSFLSSDGTSDISTSWNKLRRECLDSALAKLLPAVSTDIREKLARDSKRLMWFQIRDNFLDKVDQAPYLPATGVAKGTVPRVLAMSNGDGKRNAAVLAVAMDYDGAIEENIKFEDNFRDPAFEQKFVGLVTRFRPEVIAVSGYTPEVSYFFRHVVELVRMNKLVVEGEAEEPQAPNSDDGYDPDGGAPHTATSLVPVVWVPSETSRIFEHSSRAQQEFGDRPRVAKFCIGLARYIQNPLLEYVSLGDAITSVSFHRYQDLLPEPEIRSAVESIFVDMTCLVGVKINDVVRSEYQAQLVQYLAGLGPRKASSLIKGIQSEGGAIVRRDDLVSKELTAKVVFMNVCSFIELPVPDRYDKDVELLDATRIHPEDYELARKMASDALDMTDEDAQEVAQEEGGVVGKLYEEGVDKLDELLLEEYAKQLEEHGHRKRATLEMIKEELQSNFEELRKSFHVLSSEEVFYMLTGETADSFRVDLLVPAVVQRVDGRYLTVTTQSGVRGNLSRADILPYNDTGSLTDRFRLGQPVNAVVKAVEFGEFRANLSLLPEDVAQSAKGLKVERFKGLWDFDAENSDLQKEQAETERMNESSQSKRFIKHPFFRNLGGKQAEDYLASRENGDFVIRPSSQGPGHLTITLKLDNQLFQHIDVVEHDKLNDYTLGRVLQVGDFRYHDLDELIVSHINKLHSKVQAMAAYEKFRNEPEAEARSWLLRYSKANKNRSCYCFCFNRRAPGRFFLLFKLNDATDKIYRWHVLALPTGYQLHGNVYPDMVHLCNGFKRLLQNQLTGTQYGNYGY